MTPITMPAKPQATKHLLNKRLAPRRGPRGLVPTRITLVGAGGNGSQMVTCLARMDRCLRELGLPPLLVTLWDPDRVSPANVGRQLFWPDDVGNSKAVCLIHRANYGFGLDWLAVPRLYAPNRNAQAQAGDSADILITCVDTGAARRQIWDGLYLRDDAPLYWLDIGNEDETGQVWLGELPRFAHALATEETNPARLSCITEEFPGFYDGSVAESDNPACSLAEALRSQDLFINDHCARWAAELLWRLLRFAEIDHRGYWINLRDGSVQPEAVVAREAA